MLQFSIFNWFSRLVVIVVLSIVLFAPSAYALSIDDVFPSKETLFGGQPDGASLPTGDLKTDVIPQVIKILLAISGTLAFIAFTVGGVMMVIGQGNEDMYTKAKKIFIYATIALAVIASSYGIIYGVLTLRLQ